jgi:hypothetical protein
LATISIFKYSTNHHNISYGSVLLFCAAPDALEAASLDFVNIFEFSNDKLSRDRVPFHSLESLDPVLEHYAARYHLSGMNFNRLLQWVPSDPQLSLLLTMANTGGEVDTDPEFISFRLAGPLRPLQQRLLLPKLRFHAQERVCCFA